MVDWKAHEIARRAAEASDLGHAQAHERLTDPSRFNRALADLRTLIDDYIGA